MMNPPIGDLLEKVDCRYTLVVEAAKRARQLVDGDPQLTQYEGNKAVSVAVHEIAEGKVKYQRI